MDVLRNYRCATCKLFIVDLARDGDLRASYECGTKRYGGNDQENWLKRSSSEYLIQVLLRATLDSLFCPPIRHAYRPHPLYSLRMPTAQSGERYLDWTAGEETKSIMHRIVCRILLLGIFARAGSFQEESVTSVRNTTAWISMTTATNGIHSVPASLSKELVTPVPTPTTIRHVFLSVDSICVCFFHY